jgi:CubicO group peptidase (beta-lactamase class C family)
VADLALSEKYDRSEIAARVGYILNSYAKKGEFTGTALVIDDGQIIYRGAWGENAETKLPLSPESRIYLASAAKPITALVAALLESRGRLSYEAPVAPHFPGLAHLLKGVKLKHLLAHTSGLEDYYRSGLPVPPFTNEDALRLIAGQKSHCIRRAQNSSTRTQTTFWSQKWRQKSPGCQFQNCCNPTFSTNLKCRVLLMWLRAPKISQHPRSDGQGKHFRYAYATEGAGRACNHRRRPCQI